MKIYPKGRARCMSTNGFFRTINGIEFESEVCCHTKTDAQKNAKRFRDDGYLARIIPTKGDAYFPYCVYIAKKR